MKYYTVNFEKVIKSNEQSFWKLIAKRFGEIGEISKGVIRSKYVTDKREGIGTTRYCELPRNGFMKEAVTIWEEPNELEFEILESSIPMEKGGKLNFKMKPLEGEKLQIKVYGTFRLKTFGFLSPLLKPVLLKIIKDMLNDFENELKTTVNQ